MSDTYETKYMTFDRIRCMETGKTQHWVVLNRSGQYSLGTIKWFSGWRQYIFRPCDGTEFNHSCLADIQGFLVRLNAEQKQASR